MLQVYDQVGRRPTQIALDVYDIAAFQQALNEMKAHRWYPKILIQETVYNDSKFAAAIFQTAAASGFEVRTIMQWPVSYNGTHPPAGKAASHFEIEIADKYDANLPTPVIQSSGTGCSDGRCVWLVGFGMSSPCQVVLYSEDWKLLSYAENVRCSFNQTTARIPDSIYKSNAALRIFVINYFDGRQTWTQQPAFLRLR